MATLHTFFLASDDWREPYRLRGDEAHHLARVLRLKPGTRVRLVDGAGRIGFFSVTGLEKNEVSLALENETRQTLPSTRCTLAAGFSKALRRGWFLEKAVELEAVALWLWQGDFSQARLPSEEKAAWKKSLIAGAKQCANPWLPELGMLPGGCAELAAAGTRFDRAFMLYEGDTGGRMLSKEDLSAPGEVLLVIGPEGGFSPREAALLINAGVTPVSLGSRVLRWETAAVLALGMAWWARQGT